MIQKVYQKDSSFAFKMRSLLNWISSFNDCWKDRAGVVVPHFPQESGPAKERWGGNSKFASPVLLVLTVPTPHPFHLEPRIPSRHGESRFLRL